jgi:hypothetical protein
MAAYSLKEPIEMDEGCRKCKITLTFYDKVSVVLVVKVKVSCLCICYEGI